MQPFGLHPSVPSADALMQGAVALMERHFAAINARDEAAFRDTAYLFPQVDGEPFRRWWNGMCSLAPLKAEFVPGRVSDHVSVEKEAHVAIWVNARAYSAATRRSYRDDFVVWYLVGATNWKLGCRIHWWLDGPK